MYQFPIKELQTVTLFKKSQSLHSCDILKIYQNKKIFLSSSYLAAYVESSFFEHLECLKHLKESK